VIEKHSRTVAVSFALSLLICAASAFAQETASLLTGPQALQQAGIYDLRQIDPYLTGAGVKFTVICRSYTYIDKKPQNDYRPFTAHNSLISSNFKFHDDGIVPAGISPHSTATCSILFGRDPAAYNPLTGYFSYEGAIPDAGADIYEFVHFLYNYISNKTRPDADILTADFGQQFENWWTRGIESLAQKHGLIVVAGIGNGTDAHDPVLYPAAGANAIGVGVVDSVNVNDEITRLEQFALANPEHSSCGPTADGRCKPDIIAPGNCLAALADQSDGYEPTGNFCSFSTPVVAGTVGLLVQKAKQDPLLNLAVAADGGNCLIKAILLNSATKLPFWHKGKLTLNDDHNVPLDYIQGAGMVNAVGAYENLIAGRQTPGQVQIQGWDNNLLGNSSTNTYNITVDEPENKVIAVTLVWNKHYKEVYPFTAQQDKDGNLRLELWLVNPQNPSQNILLDYSDSTADNLEHIYFPTVTGYYNYQIVIKNSPNNPQSNSDSQRYGLAWNITDRPQENILWYDLNADGTVDDADLSVLLANLLESEKSSDKYLTGDINSDGFIDQSDVKLMLRQTTRQADWLTNE
jgi:hypothetical protein